MVVRVRITEAKEQAVGVVLVAVSKLKYYIKTYTEREKTEYGFRIGL